MVRRLFGPDNPNWKGGKCLNEKGYVKIRAGADRNAYEHRIVIRDAFRRFDSPAAWIYGPELPASMTVHHIDFQKAHNCIQNLLLLQDVIHDNCRALRAEDIPDWVLEGDSLAT